MQINYILPCRFWGIILLMCFIAVGVPLEARGDLTRPQNMDGLGNSSGKGFLEREMNKAPLPLSSFFSGVKTGFFQKTEAVKRKNRAFHFEAKETRFMPFYNLNLTYSGGLFKTTRPEFIYIHSGASERKKDPKTESQDTAIRLQLRKSVPYSIILRHQNNDSDWDYKTGRFDVRGGAAGGLKAYEGQDTLSDLFRSVIGMGRPFPSTLCVLLEYLYGNSFKRPLDPVLLRTPMEKNLFGTGLGYELTPLLHLEVLGVFDFDETSAFLGPALQYNLSSLLNLTAGVQVPSGRRDPAYGAAPGLYYAELKIFF